MAEQDWNVVTLNKRTTKPKTANAKDQQVRQAQQKGGAVHTESKGVSNKQRKGIDNYSKIDQMEEAGHVEKVSIDIARTIQQARQEKGWTQKELAAKINEQARVIGDYEAGRAVPSNQVLGKLERVLGVKLRGQKKKK